MNEVRGKEGRGVVGREWDGMEWECRGVSHFDFDCECEGEGVGRKDLIFDIRTTIFKINCLSIKNHENKSIIEKNKEKNLLFFHFFDFVIFSCTFFQNK